MEGTIAIPGTKRGGVEQDKEEDARLMELVGSREQFLRRMRIRGDQRN